MISCTNESKPLALPWRRTPRLDSGVRWPEWDPCRARLCYYRVYERGLPSVGGLLKQLATGRKHLATGPASVLITSGMVERSVRTLGVGTLATIKSLKKPCIAGFMKPINSTPPPTPPLHHHSPPPTSSSMIVTPSTPKPTTTKPLYHRMPPLL
ncbi:hypothetical protein Tco_1563128 [Tanacetum coccineum]